MPETPTPGTERRLLDAVLGVADGLELPATLRRIVAAAAELTGAPYCALGVLGPDGLLQQFVHQGVDPATAAAIGPLPRGHGLLGHLTRVRRPVRVRHLAEHPAARGFPAHHPRMDAFLGVPVGVGDQVLGNLYLTDKAGGFTPEDEQVVVALAAAAAVAVGNARAYEAERRRVAWSSVAQEVTTAILAGEDEEEALALVAARARAVARSTVAALVLPGWGGGWVVEVVAGDDAAGLVGTVMPLDGRTAAVLASGHGLRSDDLGSEDRLLVPALRRYGPAVYAPLVAGAERLGVLLLLRERGEMPFSAEDLTTAESFAGQAALALRLAEHREREAQAALREQRAGIARDLHDLAVQELFALGMRLERLRSQVPPAAADSIAASLVTLDAAVTQIRATIRGEREPVAGPSDRLAAEVAAALTVLDGSVDLTLDPPGEALDTAMDPDVADDVVAVVREGLANVARHAAATAVRVEVSAGPREVTVVVDDDGRGLPTTSHRRSGLANLAERARRHGGRLEVRPRVPRGTRLVWTAAQG